ncbi:MAG: RluA family pseudouridine synthase [Desulfovibrionaceae bacterium]|nr:RluA family pseudouridine synthase [Desulfovibrionaceae bacterium]
MAGTDELVVRPEHAGSRLDAVLKQMRELPLRARKRLVEDGRVLVNGRRGRAGMLVAAGDRVTLLETDGEAGAEKAPSCRLLSADGEMAFFAKPSGLHTVSLQGRDNSSLERQAADLLGDGIHFRLLQRLDRLTSGIVAAALTPRAEEAFRLAEKDGAVVKRYVCLVQGSLDEERLVRSRLASDGGRGMRVLADDDADPARWTRFVPLLRTTAASCLSCLPEGLDGTAPLTLAGVILHRGARHQIRVHAASMGMPLAGDTQYGGRALPDRTFYLHHGSLEALDRIIVCAPAWPGNFAVFSRSLEMWFAPKRKTG